MAYFENILLIFPLLVNTYHILHFQQFFNHGFTITSIEHIEKLFPSANPQSVI